MKTSLIIATGLTAIALFAVACNNGGGTPTPTPVATPAGNVCQPNPDPAPADILIIDSPQPSAEVTSPITVSGQVAAFEAVFRITIFDAVSRPIADLVGMAEEGQILSPFSEQVSFSFTEAGPACLWVYQESARDGSIISVGQVPVILLSP